MLKGKHQVQTVCGKESIKFKLYAERKASSSNCMRKGKHQVQTVCRKESIKFKLYAERKASSSNMAIMYLLIPNFVYVI